MYTGTTIFSQVMRHLPWHRFHRIVQHYRGDYKVKSFRCADHYRVMAFAQLTYRESLRDIEACLRAMRSKLFHMGIRSTVSRNNLSNANERRDWRIYAEFAEVLIAEARSLYTDEDLGVDLDATVYALDSTTIDLCLSVFPWARFRRTKGAIKTAYLTQPARRHSRICSDLGRETARCQRLGPPDALSRCLLHHGSRIPGFRAPVPTPYRSVVVRDPRQGQLQVPPPLLPCGGQNDRTSISIH